MSNDEPIGVIGASKESMPCNQGRGIAEGNVGHRDARREKNDSHAYLQNGQVACRCGDRVSVNELKRFIFHPCFFVESQAGSRTALLFYFKMKPCVRR